MNANACRWPISLFRVACKRGKLVFSFIPNRKEIPFFLFHDDKENQLQRLSGRLEYGVIDIQPRAVQNIAHVL